MTETITDNNPKFVTPDDTTVDRTVYVMCYTMIQVERLKEDGLVGGGPAIDEAKMSQIVNAAEAFGWELPTDDEIKAFVLYMKSGGGYEADIADWTEERRST